MPTPSVLSPLAGDARSRWLREGIGTPEPGFFLRLSPPAATASALENTHVTHTYRTQSERGSGSVLLVVLVVLMPATANTRETIRGRVR